MNEPRTQAMNDLLEYQNVERTVFGVSNCYFWFVDKDGSQYRGQRQTNERCDCLIGKNREGMTTKSEPYYGL